MNVLAACGGPDSPVRKVVFKSSAHYYGCEQDDPAFFTEDMRRPHPPRTPLERDIVEAEGAVAEFAERNPRRHGHRPALRQRRSGPRSAHVALAPARAARSIPTILGFDPRYQFIHEDDIANCLEHAVRHDLDGVYNCAADGVLVLLSEVIDLLGKPTRRCCRRGARGSRRRRCAAPACTIPAEMLQPAALRPRRWTTAATRRRASATATRPARPCSSCASTSAWRRCWPRRGEPLPLRGGGRGVPALQPERPPGGPPAAARAVARRAGATGARRLRRPDRPRGDRAGRLARRGRADRAARARGGRRRPRHGAGRHRRPAHGGVRPLTAGRCPRPGPPPIPAPAAGSGAADGERPATR